MKEQLRVLLTSCGGLVVPGMTACLREELDYRFHLVGVDMRDDAVGAHFVDSFHTVPSGTAPDYAEVLLEIAERERVQVVVPLSDEEALALCRAKKSYAERGIAVATSPRKAVETACNKGTMLAYLKQHGVAVPAFRVVSELTELDEAVTALGYPEREVIVKPTVARGGRGFWVLSDRRNGPDLAFRQRNLQVLPYAILRTLLGDGEGLPELVVMEYLTGTDYNVDVLCKAGTMLYCIPVERLMPEAGPVQVGSTVHDVNVDETCREIVSSFGFDCNINIEVAYRDPSNQGAPQVYEINPRVSAPIAIHRPAGVNLLLMGILQALGQDIPLDRTYREVTMWRCWQEVYV